MINILAFIIYTIFFNPKVRKIYIGIIIYIILIYLGGRMNS